MDFYLELLITALLSILLGILLGSLVVDSDADSTRVDKEIGESSGGDGEVGTSEIMSEAVGFRGEEGRSVGLDGDGLLGAEESIGGERGPEIRSEISGMGRKYVGLLAEEDTLVDLTRLGEKSLVSADAVREVEIRSDEAVDVVKSSDLLEEEKTPCHLVEMLPQWTLVNDGAEVVSNLGTVEVVKTSQVDLDMQLDEAREMLQVSRVSDFVTEGESSLEEEQSESAQEMKSEVSEQRLHNVGVAEEKVVDSIEEEVEDFKAGQVGGRIEMVEDKGFFEVTQVSDLLTEGIGNLSREVVEQRTQVFENEEEGCGYGIAKEMNAGPTETETVNDMAPSTPDLLIEDVKVAKEAPEMTHSLCFPAEGEDLPGEEIRSEQESCNVESKLVIDEEEKLQDLVISERKNVALTEARGLKEGSEIEIEGKPGYLVDKEQSFLNEEDEWEGIEKTEVEMFFSKAATYASSGSGEGEISKLSGDDQLHLYGLYKVATEGPCYDSQPMALKVSARAKWNAWQKLGNMNPEGAMERYMTLLSEKIPGWEGEKPEATKFLTRKSDTGDIQPGESCFKEEEPSGTKLLSTSLNLDRPAASETKIQSEGLACADKDKSSDSLE